MKERISKSKCEFAIAFAKLVSWFVRSLGLGEGATLPGRILLRLCPDAVKELSNGLPVVLISGTNAKTTTTALSSEALAGSFEVISNATGANMEEGVAFSLATSVASRGPRALGVFEVDEAYLPVLGSQLNAKVVALLNLSRDQLDRVSETRMTSAKWRKFLEGNPGIKVVANCDDPLVVYAAQGSSEVFWVAAGLNFIFDAHSCPVCGGEIEFESGGWRCTCGFERPLPEVELEESQRVRVGDETVIVELSLPGRCNMANAAIALGICKVLGVKIDSAARRMSYVSEVAGRYRREFISGHQVRMLLSKNPAGWLEVLDMVGDDPSVVVSINARVADGRDPSWLWDVPFERLEGREVFACGERASDLSVRLHYAGVAHKVVKDPLLAISQCNGEPVSFVGNYTSFQQFRKELADRGSSVITHIRKLGDRVLQ